MSYHILNLLFTFLSFSAQIPAEETPHAQMEHGKRPQSQDKNTSKEGVNDGDDECCYMGLVM